MAGFLRRIQPYDILICRSGAGGAGKGKLCFVANLRYPSCVHGHVYRMQLSELSQAPSIVVFLKSQFGKLQIERYVSGVGPPELNTDDILEFEVPLLSSQIQHDIEAEYRKVSQFHDTAIKAKEEEDATTYRNSISIAEKILNNLVQQLEEIIEGKREEIEPVDL